MDQVTKIISGGQTGVDQAALRAAIASGISVGGWCPPGRICENGIIPEEFPLQETPVERSEAARDIPRSLRTEWNVRDSQGVLILTKTPSTLDAGTTWAKECAVHYQKPFMIVDPADRMSLLSVQQWLSTHSIAVVNVAGPSEKTEPGIGQLVYAFVAELFNG